MCCSVGIWDESSGKKEKVTISYSNHSREARLGVDEGYLFLIVGFVIAQVLKR